MASIRCLGSIGFRVLRRSIRCFSSVLYRFLSEGCFRAYMLQGFRVYGVKRLHPGSYQPTSVTD